MDGEPDSRCQRDPDGKLLQPLAHHADRPAYSHDDHDGGEHSCPHGVTACPEKSPGDDGGGNTHHDELEDRPPDKLEDVQDRRGVRPAHSEQRAHEHHRRHARRAAHGPNERKKEAARYAPDQDCQEGVAQAESRHEEGARQHDEKADPQVSPENHEVDEAEHTVLPRDRLDPPFGRGLEIGE